jgi:hypothetical protein
MHYLESPQYMYWAVLSVVNVTKVLDVDTTTTQSNELTRGSPESVQHFSL